MTKGLIEKPSDASSKLVQKALADQRSVIETYLFEYCEKNNIPESELRGRLGIVSCTEDRYIGVVNCTEPDKILIGAKIEKTLEGFHVPPYVLRIIRGKIPIKNTLHFNTQSFNCFIFIRMFFPVYYIPATFVIHIDNKNLNGDFVFHHPVYPVHYRPYLGNIGIPRAILERRPYFYSD